MLKITAKDRIFAAVAIPLLLLAAYLFLLRLPLARDVAAMRARLASLGSVDTLRAERATLDRRLTEARTSLQAAEATTGGADAPPAASPTSTRLHNTLSLLTSNTPSGTLRITAYERLATGPAASPAYRQSVRWWRVDERHPQTLRIPLSKTTERHLQRETPPPAKGP